MMTRFASYDGTELGFRVAGDGTPLVCLPGGPGRSTEYLGEMGGLARSRRLILLDPRGVGSSNVPADPGTFRVDRMVGDVDALRGHLGLDRIDLLAHSAGAVLATLYAAAHPDRVSRLILVTPSLAAVGVGINEEELSAVVERRSAQPWHAVASAALEEILAGSLAPEAFSASRPLFYGRWDEAARAHATMGIPERHRAARTGYFNDVELDPAGVTAALRGLTGPVLLYAGDMDPLVTPAMVRKAAPLLGDATVIVQPGAGHFPWVDDPAAFTAAVSSFLQA
jgi:pimeloyl-ACP methyl ester carboxylesterase